MKTLNEQLMTIDKPDILFQRLLKDDTAKLDKLSVEVEKLRILLEDVPEKRKEYNTRFLLFLQHHLILHLLLIVFLKIISNSASCYWQELGYCGT